MPFFSSLRLPRRAPAGAFGAAVNTVFPGEEPQTKALLSEYYEALYSAGLNVHSRSRAWPVERAIAEGYERVIWVFKAVATIGENVARHDIPFQVITGPDDNPRVIEDHPISRMLNGIVNPMETGEVFLERLSAQLLLSKRGAFVEVTRSNMGTPVRLDLLPPGRTRIVPAVAPPLGQPIDATVNDLVSHYEVLLLDGQRREIDPDRVRWFRKPHPTDPYSGVTPLEAAGLSLELDHFARLYNASFLKNDARPGLILGIDGEMDDGDMERIDRKFGRGPLAAGSMTTIAGKISAIDLAAKPRDLQYGQTSKNSKVELLSSFGVPESQIGNAADRTYANAEAEGYSFWSITMLPHLSRLASGFLPDVEDGQRPRFATDAIEVLQLPARTRREEMRAEVSGGLRSIKSYADAAGFGDEIADTPMSRALWLPAGRTPIPAREEDAAALGLQPAGQPPAGAGGAAGADAGALPATPPDAAQPAPDTQAPPPAAPGGDQGPLFPDAGGQTAPVTPRMAPASNPAPATQGKTLAEFTAQIDALETKAAAAWHTISPADTEAAASQAIAATLTRLGTGWIERTRARVKAPKARKGTRHFVPEYANDTRVGTKALDSAYAADPETASEETDTETRQLVVDAALAAAAAWLAASTGQAITPSQLPDALATAVIAAAQAAMPALVSGASWQALRTARAVSDVDAAGGSIADVMAALTERAQAIAAWAHLAAQDAAASATEAGYDAAAQYRASGGGPDGTVDRGGRPPWAAVDVERQWISRHDGKVRPTHVKAHGQRRDLTEAFNVGGYLLRYPKDPLGPPGEVRNCRCRASYRQKSTGKYVALPAVAS